MPSNSLGDCGPEKTGDRATVLGQRLEVDRPDDNRQRVERTEDLDCAGVGGDRKRRLGTLVGESKRLVVQRHETVRYVAQPTDQVHVSVRSDTLSIDQAGLHGGEPNVEVAERANGSPGRLSRDAQLLRDRHLGPHASPSSVSLCLNGTLSASGRVLHFHQGCGPCDSSQISQRPRSGAVPALATRISCSDSPTWVRSHAT